MGKIDLNVDMEQEQADEDKARKVRNKDGFIRMSNLIYEFDCPECDANNPWEDGFAEGGEVTCHYCGQELLAKLISNGKVKFRMI